MLRFIPRAFCFSILLGFLKPDSGNASINGIDTTSSYNDARKHIGYISENVNLYPYLSGNIRII